MTTILQRNLRYCFDSEEGESLDGWTREEFGGVDSYTIYHKPVMWDDQTDFGSGFFFLVTEWVSHSFRRGSNWEVDPDSVEVREILKGKGFFDGVRHMQVGEDGEGYFNYPDLKGLAGVLLRLAELEVMYCREPFHAKDAE